MAHCVIRRPPVSVSIGGWGGRPPTASVCQGDGVKLPPKEASMEQATTIGLDIAKHVFQVHGADGAGHVLFRKRITRVKLLNFLAAQTRVSWRWKRVPVRTIGHVRLLSWAIMCA